MTTPTGARSAVLSMYLVSILSTPGAIAQIGDFECAWCDLDPASMPHTPAESATGLTERDVLLLLTYGISDERAGEIDVSVWQAPFAGDSERASPFSATTMRGPHRYREQAIRSDLVPYFETVLPVAQHNGPSVCHDCEFTLSLGMVWGYRWSTLSGHVTTPVSSMNLDNTPDYGFRLLHQATPRWRYVLALDHQQNTLDVVGEALWRIRPDVYIRLTADLYDFDLLTLPLSDLRLNFSFR